MVIKIIVRITPIKAIAADPLRAFLIPQASEAKPRKMGLMMPLKLEKVEKTPIDAPSSPEGDSLMI